MLGAVAKSIALALIVLSVLSPFVVRETSSSFQQCESAKQANSADQQSIENISRLFERAIARRCTADFIRLHKDEITAVATVLLTFVTGGLVWIGYMQIITARRQLRAYVFVIETIANLSPGANPEVRTKIKNSGETPAYQLTHVQRFALVDFPLKEKLPAAKPGPQQAFSVTNVGPDGELIKYGKADRQMTAEIIRALENGTKAIYVYGRIRYRDAFGRKRRTDYRFMTGGNVGFRPDGTFATCEEGNHAT